MADDPWAQFVPFQQTSAPTQGGDPWAQFVPQSTALIPGVGYSQSTIDPSIFANADAKESATYSANPLAAIGNDAAGLGRGANDVANAVAHAVPFGDRFSAAVNSLPIVGNDQSYTQNLDAEHAQAAQGWKDQPGLQVAANAAVMGAMPFPAATVAKATTIPAKVATSMAAGGTIGGLYGASATPDLTNVKQTAIDTAEGAGEGAAAGFVAAPIAAGIGAAARGVGGWLRPQVGQFPAAENTALYKAMGPEGGPAIGQNLSDLGPRANLMDASRGGRALGQGVTDNLGIDSAAITKPLADRAAQTNTRLSSDVNNAVGPAPPSAQIASDALADQIKPYSQASRAALAAGPPVDISPVIQTIDNELGKISPGIKLAGELRGIRNSLTQTSAGPSPPPANMSAAQFQQYQAQAANAGKSVPISDAQMVNSVRQEIDGKVNWKGVGLGPLEGMTASQQGILKDLRSQISESLKTQVPGYRDATDAISSLKNQQQAILDGSKSLGGGQNSINPNDFAKDYGPAAIGPVQPGQLPPRTPVQQGTNVGMRADIAQKLGTNPNDFSALKGMLQGAGDPASGIGAGYNSTNIGQAFGPQAETGLQNAMNREKAFAETNTKIAGNSETAARQAAGASLREATANKPLISGHVGDITTHGLFLAPARAAVNAIAAPFQGHIDAPTFYRNLAGALTAEGPRARQILADALQSGANTAKNASLGKTSEYLALLAQQLGIGAGVGEARKPSPSNRSTP